MLSSLRSGCAVQPGGFSRGALSVQAVAKPLPSRQVSAGAAAVMEAHVSADVYKRLPSTSVAAQALNCIRTDPPSEQHQQWTPGAARMALRLALSIELRRACLLPCADGAVDLSAPPPFSLSDLRGAIPGVWLVAAAMSVKA